VEKHGSMVIITKLSNNGISFLLWLGKAYQARSGTASRWL
jgi:hypothetical protein